MKLVHPPSVTITGILAILLPCHLDGRVVLLPAIADPASCNSDASCRPRCSRRHARHIQRSHYLGAPLALCRVADEQCCISACMHNSRIVHAVTDQSGEFRIENVAEGNYVVLYESGTASFADAMT